ncbi:MAG: MqnA/MqnD/SBP family protein [Bacteroidota bacterium]
MKSRLAVPDALYLKPLLFGLEKPDSPFELVTDIPAKNALKYARRSEEIRNAFLSPVDYARHGAEYCLVPNVAVSSSTRTDTIQLFVKTDARDIRTLAVDIRATTEIFLAKLVILEKFRTSSGEQSELQFIPSLPDVPSMLAKADAALVVNYLPVSQSRQSGFSLDLVEEWNDLTGLPYIHGFWVGREEETTGAEIRGIVDSKQQGIPIRNKIAEDYANVLRLNSKEAVKYLSSFSYDFGDTEKESLSEFIRFAFYHGAIGDIPELHFFDLPPLVSPSRN